MRFPMLLTTALLAGCFTMPPKAPAELDELSRFLFRQWTHDDPKVLEDGVGQLEALLAEVDLSQKLFFRSYELGPFGADDVESIDTPEGEDPANTIGLSVAYESARSIDDHARMQLETDHLAVEPSAAKYLRRFNEPEDPTCFLDSKCDAIYTDNDVTREKILLIKIEMMLHKDFKWVQMSGGRRAIVSRMWLPKVAVGKGTMIQYYLVDVWMERPAGKTWRYQAAYQEADLPVNLDPKTIVDMGTGLADESFRDSDVVIGERFHGE